MQPREPFWTPYRVRALLMLLALVAAGFGSLLAAVSLLGLAILLCE